MCLYMYNINGTNMISSTTKSLPRFGSGLGLRTAGLASWAFRLQDSRTNNVNKKTPKTNKEAKNSEQRKRLQDSRMVDWVTGCRFSVICMVWFGLVWYGMKKDRMRWDGIDAHVCHMCMGVLIGRQCQFAWFKGNASLCFQSVGMQVRKRTSLRSKCKYLAQWLQGHLDTTARRNR